MKTAIFLFSLWCLTGTILLAQPGSLDTSFGTDGTVVTNIGSSGSTDFANTVIALPDGKLLVAGYTGANQVIDFALVRYLSDGTLDPNFGLNGVVQTDFNNSQDRCAKMLRQPDGKIILVGGTSSGSTSDVALARFLPDGTLDSSFGTGGKAVANLGSNSDYPSSAALQPDGKIVVLAVRYGTGADIVVGRFNADGSLDTDFGTGGSVVINIASEDQALDITVQPDGKIVAVGYSNNAGIVDYLVLRYTSDGSPDPDFGLNADGIVFTDLSNGLLDLGTSVAISPDGGILVAGMANYSNFGMTNNIGVVKYTPDGLLDDNFGTDGIAIGDLDPNVDVAVLVVLPDGRFLVGGKANTSTTSTWMLTRFLPDGSLDATFGTDGVVETAIVGISDHLTDVTVQPDGKIVAVGRVGSPNAIDFGLARYNAGLLVSVEVADVFCFGANDGGILVFVSGGEAPYQFSLDGVNFQASPAFSNLAPGPYTVYVLDANGETSSIDVNVQEPSIPNVTFEVIEGDLIIIVAGGGTYHYSIDGGQTFQDSNVFYDLPPATYNIVVLNLDGCEVANDQLTIAIGAVKDAQASLSFGLSPNPSNGLFYLDMKTLVAHELQLTVTDLAGRQVCGTSLLPNQQHIPLDLGFLPNGSYQLKVWDGRNWGIQRLVIVR